MPTFAVVRTETLSLDRSGRLALMYVLSPFVWRQDGRFHLLVRAVPDRDDEPRLKISEAFHGVSDDGRHFAMDLAPSLFPGPDAEDLDGCEDPTVLRDGDTLRLWYTGWNQAQGTGRLLSARGSDPLALDKTGVALDSVEGFRNPKEATVVPVPGGGWRMFFECARDDASIVARASADAITGPWSGRELAFEPRPGRWDSGHVSAGPIVGAGTDRPVMFYNGSDEQANWRVGWLAFDRDLTRVVARCDEPLVMPDCLEDGWTDIAFAASVVARDDELWLYYSVADRHLMRALVREVE